MFNETGCVPGNEGEQVPAERIVPDAKEYILESIDDPEAIYDPEIWDTPGFTLVLFWLAQKWHQRCGRLADRRSGNPQQYLTKIMSRLGRGRIDPRNYPTAVGELRCASDDLPSRNALHRLVAPRCDGTGQSTGLHVLAPVQLGSIRRPIQIAIDHLKYDLY
jgi:hypothetical protein